MKKLLLFAIVAALFTTGASAQNRKGDFNKEGISSNRGGQGFDKRRGGFDNDRRGFDNDRRGFDNRGRGDYRSHSLTRGERAKMRHNSKEFNRAKHKAFRDGKLSRKEKHRLYQMKKHNRKQAAHYRHNNRHGRFS